jgi:hypothetical protein
MLLLLSLVAIAYASVTTAPNLDHYGDFTMRLQNGAIHRLAPQTFGYYRNFSITAPNNAIVIGIAWTFDAYSLHLENITFIVDRTTYPDHRNASLIRSTERCYSAVIRDCAIVGVYTPYVSEPFVYLALIGVGIVERNTVWDIHDYAFVLEPPETIAALVNKPFDSNASHSATFGDIIQELEATTERICLTKNPVQEDKELFRALYAAQEIAYILETKGAAAAIEARDRWR